MKGIKKGNWGKSFLLAAGAALAFSALAGCASDEGEASGGQQPVSSETKKLPVRYLLPGNTPDDLDAVVKAINEKLEADGLNLTYEPTYIPWDVWDQKTNLMMSTGEEFELIAIMHDTKGPNVLVGNGGIVPIDEYLDQYGPDLKNSMPDWIWESARIEGQIQYVPNFWADTAFNDGMITIRTDLLEMNGLAAPKSPEELLQAAETIKQNWPEDDKNVYIKMLSEPAYYLHTTYDTYPFTVVDNMIYVDQSGNVKSWIETEEFKQDVNFSNEAYKRGLIHPDVLTVPVEVTNKEEIAGRYLFRQGDVGLDSSVLEKFPDAKVNIYYLSEQAKFRSYAIRNSNGVSATSPHPEAAIQFLNWVYKSQDNFDLVLYGVKDVHWQDAGQNKKETLKKNQNGGAVYELANWLLGHVEMNRYPTTTDPGRLERRTTISDNAVNSITIGFNFNPSAVAAEYANSVAEMKTSIDPLRYGVISYEESFAKALSNMKAAGLDKVVAEYERQFKAWLEEKN